MPSARFAKQRTAAFSIVWLWLPGSSDVYGDSKLSRGREGRRPLPPEDAASVTVTRRKQGCEELKEILPSDPNTRKMLLEAGEIWEQPH